jgi:hypothetical protein
VPRPKEEIDRIAALVRSAIGFDAKRGGQVEVFKLRFDAGPLAPSDSESVNRGAEDLEAVFDVPVQVSAVLGRAHMEVGRLLKLGPVRCSKWAARSASDRYLRQQRVGGAWRSGACRRQARRDHD